GRNFGRQVRRRCAGGAKHHDANQQMSHPVPFRIYIVPETGWRTSTRAFLALNPRASAACGVEQLFQGDLAGIAARAHQQGAVGDAQIGAFLGRFAGQESIGESAGESITTPNAVFDFKVVEALAVVELSIVPEYGGPVVDQGRLYAAQSRADNLDVRVVLHDLVDHVLERGRIELAFFHV